MKEEHKVVVKHENPKRFRISRRLSIVLFCFFIATIFWLLLALSKEYPTSVRFPIVYKNLPGKKVIVNDLPDSISLEIKATGFKILSYNFTSSRNALEIDVASKLLSGRQLEGEVLALPMKSFASDFSRQFGPDIEIFGYQPDSIVFYFSDLVVKKVAVKLNLDIRFDRQFDFAGEMIITPDSIDVAGPPSVVNSLSEVETENIQLYAVKTEIDQTINLKKHRILNYSSEKVRLQVPVEKFTEGNVSVRIQPINIPSGYSLKTFPDHLNIKFMVALSKYNDVKEHLFDAIADADMVNETRSDKLKVELVRYPTFIRSVSIEPEKVDYIIRKQ